MRSILFAFVVLTMAYINEAHADEETTHTIGQCYRYMKEEPPGLLGAYCMGYMKGQADLLSAIGDNRKELLLDDHPFGICDAKYTTESLRFLFMNWAERNPKRWTEHFLVGVALSLREAWPCK